jgi:catechol 2,3-dioxygenase-like lactoylglutathione lyase family enzyme
MKLYATVGSNRLEEALAFYDALLGSIGWGELFKNPLGGRFYGKLDEGVFAVVKPYDGEPATVGNGTMAGFGLDSFEAVDAFHALALKLGARDEGAPGLRASEEAGAYFAYFRDPDGNKLCAYHFRV